MAKFVPDIKTQRWIVISQTRWDRPDEHADLSKQNVCVFCPENEYLTPKEILRIEGEKGQKGWKVRVVNNKFPITDIHEVIIHTPDHNKDFGKMDLDHIITVFQVYRTRYQAHAGHGQVMIFSNHGEQAGASLKHPHSQLVVIPRQINLDALVREPVMNIIEDNTYFVSYCPDFSQWPYEVWIAPKNEGTTFGEAGDDELKDLAAVFQKAIRRLSAKYHDPKTHKIHADAPFAYNFYIHHAKDWFIRIIPRLVHRAGFELGTGLSVNVVDPTDAAEELREISV